MEITVRIKSVYGNEQIYPVCDKATSFARMLGQKTLTRDNIVHIKQIGFSIIIQQNEITL